MDLGFDRAVNRTRTQHAGGESILIVLQRMTRVLLLLVGLVGALAALGLDVKTTLAGLGIGGLALALGAQKSLENVLGGVSLLMDKAVNVGNFCKIGNQLGTVEDIGLRSIKLRTRDQSLLVVPNGSLAQMQFENFGSRQKCLFNQNFSLRIETQVEQLRFVLRSRPEYAGSTSCNRSGDVENSGGKFRRRRLRIGVVGVRYDRGLGSIHRNSPGCHPEDR